MTLTHNQLGTLLSITAWVQMALLVFLMALPTIYEKHLKTQEARG